MKRFQIFKPGTHTAASGATLSFSEDDLLASVKAYDPAIHEAPIVVGHPKDNGPAYGWVSKLDFMEGTMLAEPKDVDPEFSEMVRSGRFRKRSASFYAPDAKNNPVPGVYYLRHVGFLGAAAPAVKGLKEVEFSDEDDIVEFSDDWIVTSMVARLFSGLRDFLLAEHGQEKADQVLPKYAIEDLNQAARDAQPKPEIAPSQSFTEDTSMQLTPEQIADLQAKAARVDALEAENATLQADKAKLTSDFSELSARQAEADKAATLATIKAAIDPHVKAGRVLPAEVAALADFAATLNDADASFDFNEGDKVEKVTARALFLAQLAKRPVAVDFQERAAGGDTDPGTNDAKDLSVKARAMVDEAAKQGRTLSFTEAVDAVLAGTTN